MTPIGSTDEAGGLGRRFRPIHRDVPERQRHPRDGHPRPAVVDDSFLLLFNAHDEGMQWVLPPEEFAPAWRLVIDTSGVPDRPEIDRQVAAEVAVASKGMVVLQALAGVDRGTDAGSGRRADVPTIAPVPVSDACRVRGGHRRTTSPVVERGTPPSIGTCRFGRTGSEGGATRNRTPATRNRPSEPPTGEAATR